MEGSILVIPAWYLCASGFRQVEGVPNGALRAWHRLQPLNGLAGARVEYREWDACWWSMAELIWSCTNGTPPAIYFFGYSWGAGWGFIRLAWELRRRGLPIASAVLSDPVYRTRWMPDWLPLNPVSMINWERYRLQGPKIKVPDNVKEVHWFHQKEPGLFNPRGHRVVAVDPKQTKVHPGVLIKGVDHQYMDEVRPFQNKILEVAEFSSQGKVRLL